MPLHEIRVVKGDFRAGRTFVRVHIDAVRNHGNKQNGIRYIVNSQYTIQIGFDGGVQRDGRFSGFWHRTFPALRFIARSPRANQIRLRLGHAIDTLREIPSSSADFVFIDADKLSYADYYAESLRILRHGGLIAVDNVFWSGRVLDPKDEDSRAIAEFNEIVKNDERVEKVMLSIRDGVYLIRKL
ncbi:MAG: hypothetical protein P8Y77_07430 [Nitrospirota bacterium]